jgi:hypothetical protein
MKLPEFIRDKFDLAQSIWIKNIIILATFFWPFDLNHDKNLICSTEYIADFIVYIDIFMALGQQIRKDRFNIQLTGLVCEENRDQDNGG